MFGSEFRNLCDVRDWEKVFECLKSLKFIGFAAIFMAFLYQIISSGGAMNFFYLMRFLLGFITIKKFHNF